MKKKQRKRFSFGDSGKLVRDKTMEQACKEDPSSSFSYKYLNDNEIQPQLLNKLQEEVAEILEAETKDQLCSELADLLDVIDAIKKHNSISAEELTISRIKKSELLGKFDNKLFIEWMECESSETNKWYKYALLNPHKYPELEPNDL